MYLSIGNDMAVRDFSGIVYKLADVDVDAAAQDFVFQIFQ